MLLNSNNSKNKQVRETNNQFKSRPVLSLLPLRPFLSLHFPFLPSRNLPIVYSSPLFIRLPSEYLFICKVRVLIPRYDWRQTRQARLLLGLGGVNVSINVQTSYITDQFCYTWHIGTPHMYTVHYKHRKNCEGCPVTLFIVMSLWLSCFEILNCQKFQQFHNFSKIGKFEGVP